MSLIMCFMSSVCECINVSCYPDALQGWYEMPYTIYHRYICCKETVKKTTKKNMVWSMKLNKEINGSSQSVLSLKER